MWSASGSVADEALGKVQHLLDHGEPAEGLLELAWIIVNEKTSVPMSVIRDIRRYSEELIPADLMPPDLDSHGLSDEVAP